MVQVSGSDVWRSTNSLQEYRETEGLENTKKSEEGELKNQRKSNLLNFLDI